MYYIIEAIKRKLAKEVGLIVGLVVLSFISDYLSILIGRIFHNNMPWFHFYVLLESILLITFFSKVSTYKKIYMITMYGLIGFLFVDMLFLVSILKFNTIARLVQCTVMVTSCLWLFYEVYVKEEVLFIDQSGVFWIIVGVFIYFSGAFFSFLIYRNLQFDDIPVNKNSTWIYHNSANVLKNVFFAIGIWQVRKV